MNKYLRAMALLLAVMMLGTAAIAEETEKEEQADLLLLTIEGVDIYASHVKEMAQSLYEYGYLSSEEDYLTTLQYIVNTNVEEKKIKDLGFDQFTIEETEAFTQEAETEYGELLEEWMAYYQTSEEPTEEEKAALRGSVMDYFASMGYTLEAIVEDYKYSAGFDRLVAWLEENFDISVSEDDVRSAFEEGAEMDRQSYENDIETFEIYTTYYGVESWYIPEGYRGIIQILLEVDENLLNDYTTKLASYEETLSSEENAEGEASVALEDVEAAREAVLNSCQETIDEIYMRLENGEAFADLIPEYNTDPGMNDEQRLQEGYMVHPSSFMDEAFLDAVFSEKMQKPGDVSDPSVGMYGIYIAYYLRDVPSGYVELDEELYAEIEDSLLNEKLTVLYDELLIEWAKECEIVYHEDRLMAFAGITVKDGILMTEEATEE